MTTRFQPGWTESIRIRDIDECFAPPGYQIEFITTGGREFYFDRRVAQLEHLHLAEVAEVAGLARRGECVSDALTFAVVTAARQMPSICGRALATDQLIALSPRREFSTFVPAPCVSIHMAIGQANFQRCSEAVWGPGRSELVPNQPLILRGAAERAALIRIWARALDFSLANPDFLVLPRVVDFLEAECMDALLTCTDNVLRRPPRRTAWPAGRHGALRRAMAYIDAHIADPIHMPGLCEAVGSSLRPLEIAFRESFGITPKAYINLKRMHRARRDLRRFDPTQTSVTAIATRWGFFHLGRFAQQYRRMFGESPRATLSHGARPETLITLAIAPTTRVPEGSWRTEGPAHGDPPEPRVARDVATAGWRRPPLAAVPHPGASE